MSGREGWFKTGEEGATEAHRIDDENERRRKEAQSGARRFWLPPDKSANVTFLDSLGFYLREHQVYLARSWLNWFTCRADFDNCPLCDSGMYASYVAMYTVVDHSEFQLKRGPQAGQIIKDQKRLFVVKSTARNKLLKQKERQDGDLTLCRFECTRYTSKECSTGEDFHFIERATMEEILSLAPSGEDAQEWAKPFDYAKLFYPKSAEELSKIIGETPPVGAGNPPQKDAESPPATSEGSEEIGRYL